MNGGRKKWPNYDGKQELFDKSYDYYSIGEKISDNNVFQLSQSIQEHLHFC